MPTSRTLGAVLLGAALAMVTGCAANASSANDEATSAAAFSSDVTGAGITEGSVDAEGVLILCNDRAVTAATLTTAGIDAEVAKSIVDYRTNTDGTPRWFASLDDVDALPNTDANVCKALNAEAKANGDEEVAGFIAPTLAQMSIPDGLGHPPTSADVTVVAGFDGLSPQAAFTISRSRITNPINPANEEFVQEDFIANHKMFTIAVGNLFVANSPDSAFLAAKTAGATSVEMLGTMSVVHPTILQITRGNRTDLYARGPQGNYMPMAPVNYPVVMRAKLNLDAANEGIRIFYPAWSAKQLEQTGSVTEEP